MKLVKQVDGVVQSVVDAVAIAFMRTFGVRKSFVRYAITLGVVGISLLQSVTHHSWVFLLPSVIWLVVAEWSRRYDERAEAAGMRSGIDNSSSVWFMNWFWVAWLMYDVFFGRRGGFGIAVDVLFLALEYIRDTPSEPPPTKKTVLPPAEASS